VKIDRAAYEGLIPKLTSKRARIVLERILKDGSISTDELRQMGYSHPPRAAQDLKEAGVALRTVFTKRHPKTGNRMGSYVLDAPAPITEESFSGRGALPKNLEDKLYEAHGVCCNMDGFEHGRRVLQADHRIPFLVGGDPDGFDVGDWQVLCASHQRKKSFECENCGNSETRDLEQCRSCFWAFPEDYSHVALRDERRVTVIWAGEEVEEYERLKDGARQRGLDIPTLVRERLDSQPD
jgi:hypothetical protein